MVEEALRPVHIIRVVWLATQCHFDPARDTSWDAEGTFELNTGISSSNPASVVLLWRLRSKPRASATCHKFFGG